MSYAAGLQTVRIDLNRLRGEHVWAHRPMVEMPRLSFGDLVLAIEEEGDQYLATLEDEQAGRWLLRLDMDSFQPGVCVTITKPCPWLAGIGGSAT